MSKEYVIAKYESHGERFEILVKPKEALELRKGKSISISDIVVSDNIYKDVKKGLKASPSSLKKVFGTLDYETIVKEIIMKGEIPLTSEQRKEILESKRKQILNFIAKNTIDPKTNMPIPLSRIENAMEQVKVSIDPNKDVEQQSLQIIKELVKIIPIKMARALVEITIPAKYSSRVKNQVQSLGDIKKSRWLSDGTWIVEMEIPAGAQSEIINRINSLTKGEGEVKILQVS